MYFKKQKIKYLSAQYFFALFKKLKFFRLLKTKKEKKQMNFYKKTLFFYYTHTQ